MSASMEALMNSISLWKILQWTMTFAMTMAIAKVCLFAWNFQILKEKVEKLPGLKRWFLLGNVWDARIAFFRKLPYPNNVFLSLFATALSVMYKNEGMCKVWLLFRPCLLLFKANTIEPLISSSTAIHKSFEYNFLKGWLGTGLLTSAGTKWKSRRKMLTPSFHFRILEEFQPIISEQSHVLVQTFSNLPDQYCPDLFSRVNLCALDIIAETALGLKIFAQTNEDSSYVRALSSMGRVAIHRVLRPWLWNDFLFGLTPLGREAGRSLKILHNFTKKVIRDRKQNYCVNPDSRKGRLAFLDMLLQEHYKDESFTETDIQEEVDTFTFEGHDTTATGVTWCLYMLGIYQDIQQKVYEELLSIFGNEKDTPITVDHLKDMKYLDCVIKETMRLFPPVPMIARDLKEDLIINKETVPAGTTCFITVAELHRDHDYFPNPEIFDPDRFLYENSVGRHPYAYIPFSAGPRNCIGQKFAMNEEKTLVSAVVRNFKLTSLDNRDKIIVCPELVSRPTPAIRMEIQIRE